MKRALITGAAGFIGYHLAKYMVHEGEYKLLLVDNFLQGTRDHLFTSLLEHENVRLIEGDLTEWSTVKQLPLDVELIFHLAALNGTPNFYERPFEVMLHGTLPTVNLVRRYRDSRTLKRFVYAGTPESYATTVDVFKWAVPTDETVPLALSDVGNPRWSYGASKIHGEILVANCLGQERDIPYTILRYHNIYGPRMGDKHVIPQFLARLREGRAVLYGHKNTRSFMYVDDAVALTEELALSDRAANEIVNVGGSREVSMVELAELILEIVGRRMELELHDAPVGSVMRRAPDVSKLHAITRERAEIGLREGVRRTVEYYWG